MDADAEKGRALYISTGNCITCHGESGKGDGPVGVSLNPKPRNFRNMGDYKQGSSQEAIAATIKNGVPGSAMPPNPAISEADRMALAKYVIYLQTQP